MNLLNLSEILHFDFTIQEMIDYLLENGYQGIINNIPPPPHVEYYLDDLLTLNRKYF